MREAAVLESVADIIRQALARPGLKITPETRALNVPGWDSFEMVGIIIAVQDRFGIELETRELDGLRNVGDLVRAITARRVPAVS
jgi:acyl carrier protein